ncbi:MAG: efflux RND transporter periplasmic adaptor subunit [Bacillota bacterium]
MKKIGLIMAALMLITIFINTGCAKQTESATVELTAAPVEKQYIEAFGKIAVKDIRNITIEIPAVITEMKVTEGQRVKKGDVLAVLDISDYESRIAAKEKELNIVKLELEKAQGSSLVDKYDIRILKERKSILELELQAMKVKLNEAYLSNTNVVSDVENGVVLDLGYQRGDVVNGRKLLSIMNMDTVVVNADVPEEFISEVKLGAAADIILTADKSKVYKGHVAAIASKAVQQGGETTVAVQIALENTDSFLVPGFNTDVNIYK